ncbi:sigma-E factor negative regulatory protein [Aliidiomarina haloalkalitolerans]|uniref:Anti-sigma-E factor RseA n=1 Tax=Aliidiomarina haloalkalitolerans TaxID=859059 RepID=A0A432VXY9_9GAMM|nr:RseA family anti-sigma factor [Aliidiomarina haloalkalitolerans]RUO21544.1 hypothetical protein CWE06_01415 [Aliidiomarina haloalkalitolerans]
MTEHQQEKLSALMDGQLDKDAVEGLVEHAAQRERWYRYQLVSAVIRGEAQSGHAADISAAVAAAIAAEPQFAQEPSSAWSRLTAWVTGGNWLRPAANVAVAASVAVVAIIGVQNLQPIDDGVTPAETQNRANPVFETMPFGGVVNPVSFNTMQTPQQDSAATSVVDADFERVLLQSFMVDHQQQLKLSQQEEVEATEIIDRQDP